MLAATLLAFGSAALHAAWNLLIKTSANRLLAAWGQFLIGGLIFLPLVPLVGVPEAKAWPFLVISSVVHVFYTLALVRAYHHGDFSFAYPLARGGGALLAAIGGVVFLGDVLSAPAWLAIAIVVGGLASLVRPNVTRIALLWAGLTAVTIGIYTTLDAAGSRRASSGVGYGITLVLGAGIALTAWLVVSGHAADMGPAVRLEWRRYVAGGICSTLAYTMVLVAVRLAPVGYVAALRESSVVLGAAAGWFLLHERLGRARVASSAVVAGGLVLLIVVR
ncbi:MAG: EamA family transporter [Acidimicrobiia bacterium]